MCICIQDLMDRCGATIDKHQYIDGRCCMLCLYYKHVKWHNFSNSYWLASVWDGMRCSTYSTQYTVLHIGVRKSPPCTSSYWQTSQFSHNTNNNNNQNYYYCHYNGNDCLTLGIIFKEYFHPTGPMEGHRQEAGIRSLVRVYWMRDKLSFTNCHNRNPY